MRYAYPARLQRDQDNRVLVSFPDVPEALTDGSDEPEALAEARDALAAALAGYVHAGTPLPTPSAGGDAEVAVPTLIAAKLALYQAMRRHTVTKSELARRLGISEGAARRLVDPDHSSKIEKVEAALAAVGESLVVDDVAA